VDEVPDRFEAPDATLRRLRASDALAIYEGYARDPEVIRYLSWRPAGSLAETAAFLADVAEAAAQGRGHVYAIVPSGERELRGAIGFDVDGGTLHFGYVLARSHWGRGLVSGALRRLSDWGLGRPGVFRVDAFCHVENRGSARVMEKAGLQFEGRLRRHALYPNRSEEPADSLFYARVR